jgi:hypothetical protein
MLGLSVGFSTSRGMSCSQTTPPLCNTAGWSFFSRVERSQKAGLNEVKKKAGQLLPGPVFALLEVFG